MKIKVLYLGLHFLLVNIISGYSQTPISGIINTYIPVTAITVGSGCTTTLPVFTVGSTAGLSATAGTSGNKVLIIQMQAGSAGAVNNGVAHKLAATYGAVTNYGGAGNYEFALISSLTATTITFTKNLINTYDVAGKVQIIPVTVYSSGVTTTGALTGQAWNGTTGGVLLLETSGTITMNHTITMAGLGFRGGVAVDKNSACCNTSAIDSPGNRFGYYFDEANTGTGCSAARSFNYGNDKGEGIFPLITNQRLGRGAFANAGGGGSGHNSGGGGGSNCGSGGQGGYEYESCGQEATDDMGGIGGYSMPNGATSVFMGGGGGAGHGNNAGATSGANGGGIIILSANSINVTAGGLKIDANGLKPVLIANSDGAGGGGGGGAILLNVASYSGSALTISAEGGQGGENSSVGTCHAAGGGGGGGFIKTSASLPITGVTITSNGGLLGANTAGCLAFGGNAGINCPATSGLVLNQNLCTLPITLISFSGNNYGEYNKISWTTGAEINSHYMQVFRSPDTYSWENIGTIMASGSNSSYSIIDDNLKENTYYYRLLKMDYDGRFEYSSSIIVSKRIDITHLQIIPNQIGNGQTFDLIVDNQTISSVRITDIRGVEIYQRNYQNSSNKVSIENFTSNIGAGLFYVSVETADGQLLNSKLLIK